MAEREKQTIHYEGNVRAWRGTDVVESSALDIDRRVRRLTSGERVLTSFFQATLPAPGGEASSSKSSEERPVTVRADRLVYLDQAEKASYRGHVELQTESTLMRAERMDVYFRSGPVSGTSAIERTVAEGNVEITQPGRRARGQRAEYFAADGKILLYDKEKGFTTGQRLTFFTRNDTLLVDGGDESPTLSRHRIAQ